MTNRSSVTRQLQDKWLASLEKVSGKGIDLGAKCFGATYHYNLGAEPEHLDLTDKYPRSSNVKPIDLSCKFPIEDNSYNYAILNNVLEHLPEPLFTLNQTQRILKPGGRLIGTVPYLYPLHPDPDDYFRFSCSCLRNLFTHAGFTDISVTALGYGPCTCAFSLLEGLIPVQPLVYITFFATRNLDRLLNRSGNLAIKYAQAIGFDCTTEK